MNIFENITDGLPQDVELSGPVRKGDKIIILKSRNNSILPFTELDVLSGSKTAQSFSAKCSQNKNWTIYRSGPADDYISASDRKTILTVLQIAKENIDNIVEYYTKYSCEEEFVADKIEQLLNADGVGAKAEILRVLKKSNFL